MYDFNLIIHPTPISSPNTEAEVGRLSDPVIFLLINQLLKFSEIPNNLERISLRLHYILFHYSPAPDYLF